MHVIAEVMNFNILGDEHYWMSLASACAVEAHSLPQAFSDLVCAYALPKFVPIYPYIVCVCVCMYERESKCTYFTFTFIFIFIYIEEICMYMCVCVCFLYTNSLSQIKRGNDCRDTLTYRHGLK